jgi:hypothetical protein
MPAKSQFSVGMCVSECPFFQLLSHFTRFYETLYEKCLERRRPKRLMLYVDQSVIAA